jgi:Na+/H+ antiporter NhaA
MTHADAQNDDHSQARGHALIGQFAAPLRNFLATETGSAGLLLTAAVVAMAWANSPLSDSYVTLWGTEIGVRVAGHALTQDLTHWVNDGLMVIFFFVVGLELRHEVSSGEMRQRRALIIPCLGAIGGLIVPALLYIAINPSGDALQGWGVVIGTDTAFLLGALTLVGPRAPAQLRVFLLTMTIADDLIAVAVIGAVYSDSINFVALAIAVAALAVIALLGKLGVWQNIVYAIALFVAWLATVQSGLHPSITGMLAGLLVVSHAPNRAALDRAAGLFKAFRQSPLPRAGYQARRGLQRAVSVNERLQELLHPWTSYLIVPIFALANAGVDLRGGLFGEAMRSPITWGVVIGLVVGKPIGIGIAALAGSKLNWGSLPRGVGPGQLIAGGALSGLGFSVSILIASLAFTSPELRDEAIVGVLLACVFSVGTGWIAFRLAAVLLGERSAELPMELDPPINDAAHIRGPIDAPLTLTEYGDYECPFCGAATTVLRDLRERFGDELRYVFRHLPLQDVHPHAELAAQAAEAAGAQGRFWEMHDLLFEHQDELELEDLIGYAARLDLDVEEFTRSLNDGRYAEAVREDVVSAEASGARSTPTFFIGNRRHTGPYDAGTLTRELLELRAPVRGEENQEAR